MRRRLSLAAFVLVIAAWDAALIAAPVTNAPRLSGLTYLSGALICHQRPERSFHRNGAQYPVCARCLGLYLGAGFGVVGWVLLSGIGTAPRARASRLLQIGAMRRLLIISALPTLGTVAVAWAGVWESSNLLRAVLAVPLGLAIAAIVTAVAAGDLR